MLAELLYSQKHNEEYQSLCCQTAKLCTTDMAAKALDSEVQVLSFCAKCWTCTVCNTQGLLSVPAILPVSTVSA